MKTVKVRIAVAIGRGGDWSAYGGSGQHDDISRRDAAMDVDEPHKCFWVEADIPIEPQTISGKVLK